MNQAYTPASNSDTVPWLDAVAFGLVLCDARLSVLQANGRSGEMLGTAAAAMCGRHLFNLLELPERHCTQALQALEQGQPWQGLSRSGERALKVEIRSTGDGAVASLIDYSADLEHLQRLTDAKSTAEKSNEAKSQFLHHMSHELRTPLNAIIGFTQLLKISEHADERELDNIAEIEKAGASLLALINEILDLSKIEAGKLKLSEAHIDLHALADECIQLSAPLSLPRQIEVQAHIAGDGLLVADYLRLKQILMNLLSNAIRYNHDGGKVSLHCLAGSDNHIRLEIRDSGAGIAREHLHTIFSPFERLGSIEGSGIGLMITRRLVVLMQGQIGVFSLPGRGSVFWVELPRKRLSVLESMLLESAAPVAAAPCGPLFWIGPRTHLFHALENLRELRPALSLRQYATLADARDALQLESPGLVLVREESATSAELEGLAGELATNQLKHTHIHVVSESTECRNPDEGRGPCGHGQSAVPVHENSKLTVLLDLLDSYMNRV